MICQCLLQIYKCTREHKLQSYRYVGATELVPLLGQVLKHILRTSKKQKNVLMDLDEVVHLILRVLRVFSKLVPAKSVLVKCLRSPLLGHLATDALKWVTPPDDSMGSFSPNIFWETLGLLKDLTFRSKSNDNEVLLIAEGGVLYRLLTTCCTNAKSINPRLQEWFTAVVWNLALDREICQHLIINASKESAGGRVVQGLLETLMHHSVNGKNSELSTKIKRNASSALGNIVADYRYHGLLLQSTTSANTLALLPTLTKVVEGDSDSVVRRRTMRTIRCLVSSPDPGIKSRVQSENLSESFLSNIIGRNTSLDDENDHDTQIQACQAVIAMSDSINPSGWSQLEIALVQRIETTTVTKLIAVAGQGLAECIKRNCSKEPRSFSEIFWKRLETAVTTDATTHKAISSLYLVLMQSNGRRAEQQGQDYKDVPSFLTIDSTVNAMSSILNKSAPTQGNATETVLQVLAMLVEAPANKKPLAENEELLSSLVNICLVNPGTTKDCAKRLVLELVPEI